MVYIGSARVDERGKYSGGQKGDQKQTSTNDCKGEVSQQPFYVHSKGWYVLRPKKPKDAQEIARAMIRACNNINVGYSQSDRLGIVKDGTASTKPTNGDCSSVVRQCVKEATGKDAGNFNTSNEVSCLEKTGVFEKAVPYTKGMPLLAGDVLVTKTKGHTAIVTSGDTVIDTGTTRPTLRVGSKGADVLYLHKQLKKLGYGVNVNSDYFDSVTKACVENLQASNPPAKVDGVVGKETWKIVDSIK